MRLTMIVMVMALAAGCQSQKKSQPTPSEQAQKDWNAARAGVLVNLAKEQYQNGNLDKCRLTINDALKLMPSSEPLHVLSARVAIEQGQPEFAERELQIARRLLPADAEPDYLSGVVYQRWQKMDIALECYAKAVEKAPAELSYVLAEAEMLVALNRSSEALTLLQARVTYFEHSGTIRDAVGQLLMQQGRYAEAASVFREASILSEDDAGIRERLAGALYQSKNYRDCSEVIGRLVETDAYSKRADLFVLEGECQLQLRRPRDAQSCFETASQLEPLSAPVWQGLGRAALESGDFRRADLALAKSVSLDAAVAETHLLLGYVRLREDRVADALGCFKKASSLDGGDTVSLCMVGYAFSKLGDNSSAMKCYSRALKINPADDMARELISGLDLHD